MSPPTARLALRLAPFLALLAASPAAAESGLAAALGAAVDASPLANARVGILVEAVDTGEVVYARDPDVLLNPASNVKLVTTAAALARLGPDFRFSTEFLVDAAPPRGEGRVLYVRGKGDPTLVTERLWAAAGELAHLGLRKVTELVLDDGWFDAERTGPGFDQEEGDRAYLAPAGALSLNWNTVEVHVAPGDRVGQRARVSLEPASAFLAADVRAVTVGPRGGPRVEVSTELRGGKERVVVDGRVPAGARPHVLWRRVDDPTLYFGYTLAALLDQRGVKVGRVRAGHVPDGARLLHLVQSDPLAEVVRRLNKTSNNFTAEQLLKALGAEVKGPPGSWPKGVLAAEEFLADVGLPPGSYVMRNGSGMNDANRFSARQLVTLLRAMWARFPLQPEFVVSLPVAARDGTIRWRMEGTAAAGRLRAKTGTLDGVATLSGYVQDAGGRVLAFAVLVNDSPGRPGVLRAVDGLGAALAASGGPAPGSGTAALASAMATAASPPPIAAPSGDAGERVRTYYTLGRQADARNLPFLRGALRAEADPTVRLALGECVYLSDPDGDSARRAFLDVIGAEARALAQLWTLVPGGRDSPVISSLSDLAAEAEPEALRRLVELAGGQLPGDELAAAVADGLAAAAAGAPEELVAALRAAPPGVRDLAAARLMDGLGRSEEKDHPFPAALRTMAAREDEGSEYARSLLALLPSSKRPPQTP